MKELNLNFGKLYWEMFQDERLIDLSNDGIILYTKMLDKMNLSKSRNYVDENGEVYILFTEKESIEKCRIKKKKFFELKKKLKELGLIHYNEQKVKKAGVSTPIYVKHYEIWSKEFVVVEEGLNENLNINYYTQQPPNCEPIVEIVEENNEAPEGIEEISIDNTQNVIEDSTQGLEDSNNDIDIHLQQNINGFGIHEGETLRDKSMINNEHSNDRKMVYIKTNQYGQMVEVYRYDKGIKEDLIKSAERQGFKLNDFLNKINKYYGAKINYI